MVEYRDVEGTLQSLSELFDQSPMYLKTVLFKFEEILNQIIDKTNIIIEFNGKEIN